MDIKKYYHAPWPGLLAFLMVFVWQGLGHTVMILMQKIFGQEWQYESALFVGLVGAICVWVGRNKSELSATLWGFTGGSLIWTGWVEFAFVWVANYLGVEPDGKTKPEYRVMVSSIGVLFATLLYFYFNKETRCNLFRWMHRNLHMNPGVPSSGQGRNIASLVAMEAVYVTWFFYIALLLLYDTRWAGDRSIATYSAFLISFIWGLYLLQRLVRFQRVAPALRYGIPTAIILWNCVEIAGRWGRIREIWLSPEKYGTELAIMGLGLVAVVALSILSPARQPVDVQ